MTPLEQVVTDHQTVPRILPPGSSLATRGEPVLATGVLIAMLENATWDQLAPGVPGNLALLGRGGVYEHTAPALPGHTLRFEVSQNCSAEQGHQLWTARAVNLNTGRVVGVLHHEVATIERDRFYRRLNRSLQA